MVNYLSKCAITGIDIPDLLFASHIIPWSKNEDERLNPENGICLSALYDRAFDKGYISINDRFEVLISPILKKKQKENYYEKYFAHLSNFSASFTEEIFAEKRVFRISFRYNFQKINPTIFMYRPTAKGYFSGCGGMEVGIMQAGVNMI